MGLVAASGFVTRPVISPTIRSTRLTSGRSPVEYVIRHTVRNVTADSYLRVRGTGTDEAEPAADGKESPWEDLWFYSNPIFVTVG